MAEFTAHYLPEVDKGYGFNQQELIAKTKPEVCQNLNQFLREVRLKLDRLWDLPSQVKIMADCIKDIKWSNYNKEKNNNNE